MTGPLGPRKRLGHIELLATGQHSPSDAGAFVRERDDSLVMAPAVLQLANPAAESIVAPVSPAHRGTCAMNHQGPQVTVPIFGYSQ